MFKKLVGLIPFNPSLVDQLSAYGKNLERKSAIRRVGLIFMILGLAIQLLATIWPPQVSLASSRNDLLIGGFHSQEDAVSRCQANIDNYLIVLHHFGITCDDLADAKTETLHPARNNQNLVVLGKLYYDKPGQQAVEISGNTYWFRYLWQQSTRSHAPKQVLSGTTDDNEVFYVLYESANLVLEQAPLYECNHDPELTGEYDCKPYCQNVSASNEELCPLVQAKTIRNKTLNTIESVSVRANPGDLITYVLTTTNNGPQKVSDYNISDNISDILDYGEVVDLDGGWLDHKGLVTWPPQDIEAKTAVSHTIQIKIKNPLPHTPISSTDPGHFDLNLTNFYGNATNVKLSKGVIKTIEALSTQLHDMGARLGIMLSFGLTLLTLYAHAHSRLLIKEIKLVRHEHAHGDQ